MRALTNINWINLYLSIAFSFLFVYIIPWNDLKEFNDIKNYLNRMTYLNDGGTERVYSGISIVSSEIVWKYLLIYLSSLEVFEENYRSVLHLISFVSLFLFSQFSFKRVAPILFMLLAFNPLFMHLIIEQVRIALAFSLLLLVYEYRDINWIYLLLPICVLIHTAVLLLVCIYCLLYYIRKYSNKNKVYLKVLITSFLIAVFLNYSVDYVLAYLGDRRVNYTLKGSGLLFSTIWIIYATILVLYCNKKNTDLMRIASYSIFMMGLFFTSSLIGFFGQRFIALSIPLIIISLNGITNYRIKNMVFLTFGLYNLVSWFYWFKLFKYI
jgi:hypothetical protein